MFTENLEAVVDNGIITATFQSSGADVTMQIKESVLAAFIDNHFETLTYETGIANNLLWIMVYKFIQVNFQEPHNERPNRSH